MILRHPRNAALSRVADGAASNRVTRHVAGCERCTDMLELETAPAEEFRAILADVVAPRPGFLDEVAPRVTEGVEKGRVAEIVADLFGAGWDTVWLLASPEDDYDNE